MATSGREIAINTARGLTRSEGVADSPSKTGSEMLFDVISSAYESQSLIVTTNLPFENWTEVLSSERLTGQLWTV